MGKDREDVPVGLVLGGDDAAAGRNVFIALDMGAHAGEKAQIVHIGPAPEAGDGPAERRAPEEDTHGSGENGEDARLAEKDHVEERGAHCLGCSLDRHGLPRLFG